MNEEVCLSKLLSSIKEQSFTDYEIIIADHLSSDNTIHIANKYTDIIVDGGLPGVGRNNGAKVATGDIILFLDADVILPKDFLKHSINEFQSRGLGVATVGITPLSNRLIDCFMHDVYNNFVILTANVMPYAPGFCIFVNRTIHNMIGGFNERIRLGEDSEYVQRASRLSVFGILHSERILVSVRRLDEDGRLNVVMKYILSGLYMLLIGNIYTDIFKYRFGKHKE